MCGGFVTLCSNTKDSNFLPQVSYNFGRLLTYSTLGFLAGLIGSNLNLAGDQLGLNSIAAIIVGTIMIIWGSLSLFPNLVPNNNLSRRTGKLLSLFGSPVKYILSKRTKVAPTTFSFLLGFVSTFLPCGWLYTYVAYAATTGSPYFGTMVMVAFWLGTVPILLGFGTFTNLLSLKLRQYVPKFTAVLLITAGFFSMFTHLDIVPLPFHDHHHDHSSHSH